MFRKVFLVLLLFNIDHFEPAEGYKILGICPISSRSHFNMLETLMKGLAKRGHEVEVVSHYPQKKIYKNYKDLSLRGSISDTRNNINFTAAANFASTFWIKHGLENMGIEFCKLLGHPVMQNLINKSPNSTTYDLVIIHMFLSPCFFAFGRHLNIPMILYSASGLYDWMTDSFGNPANPSFVPTISLGYTEHMNFQQRLTNTVTQLLTKLIYNYESEVQNEYVEKYFGPGFPNIHDLQKNASLVLVNSHYSLSGVRPFTNAVVEVGGLHLELEDDHEELPVEIKKWLDESEHGCIYITFGSMINIESFPEKILQAFYKTFEKISPVRVLMKIGNIKGLAPGLPSNVKTFSWLPQLTVLKHKNVKIFVTHGGLFSTTESIISKTPMIGIPIFTDQFININNNVKRSVAIKLDLHSINEETFTAAINNILLNPAYRNNIDRLSKLYLDRPKSPQETAIFWVEYVGRHGNVLKSPAVDLEWWEVYLLDVYALLLFIFLICAYIIYFIIKKLINVFNLCTMKGRKDLMNKKEK